ncbi:helix-turn-helix domain-containing protein [Enterococcus avium]|uniref:helix-turn-helix domain-containing protein n=1 Tax=Enterococcus avium TaxID=33945 RepID=UPI00321C026A
MMIYTRIKSFLSQKGISVNKLETELELSNGSISKWNDSVPSADKLAKVAKYLGTTVEELLEDEEKVS